MAIALLKNRDKKNRIRKGRGNASGHGGESGRGHKGQKSRSGYSKRAGFEGGQTPLYRRLPKSNGFNNIFKETFDIININRLEECFDDGDVINKETLLNKNLITGKYKVKLLAYGKLTKKFIITVDKASKSAVKIVKKLNGDVNLI
ncbi:50S ribosomal protein L15 [Candidatus Marinamargulisbacteria bacterium SCGC AG-333-B06]|nr:50S ribosomal protein L15 [Candidatus Marinamargulisbacteria bacterium SCGC AG-333-B06]